MGLQQDYPWANARIGQLQKDFSSWEVLLFPSLKIKLSHGIWCCRFSCNIWRANPVLWCFNKDYPLVNACTGQTQNDFCFQVQKIRRNLALIFRHSKCKFLMIWWYRVSCNRYGQEIEQIQNHFCFQVKPKWCFFSHSKCKYLRFVSHSLVS